MHRPASPRSGRAAAIAATMFVLAVAVVAIALWRMRFDRHPVAEEQVDLETQIARERAAVEFGFAPDRAREALRPLVEREDARPADLADAAAIELALGELERARGLLERALAADPGSARAHYGLGQVASAEADFEAAREHLEKAVQAAPDDLPAQLALGQALEALGEDGMAEALYRRIVAAGVDQAGSWYLAALYRLQSLRRLSGDAEEAQELIARWQELKDRGVTPPTDTELQRGNLMAVPHPSPRGNDPAGPGPLPEFGEAVTELPELAGSTELLAADIDNDGLMDLAAFGPAGLAVGLQREGFAWKGERLLGEPVLAVLAFDLGNDGDLDLAWISGGVLRILEATRPQEEIVWTPRGDAVAELGSAPEDWLVVDYDHDGDLDLLLVGAFGVRLLRDDGAASEGGAFTDVTTEAGLPRERAFSWALIEDLDSDQDVDLLLGGDGGLLLASNQRGGRFADETARIEGPEGIDREPLAADLDGDGRPDLWLPGRLWLGRPSARLERAPAPGAPEAIPAGARIETGDLDLDGSLDAWWRAESGEDGWSLRGRLSVGLGIERPFDLELPAASAVAGGLVADLDGGAAEALAFEAALLTAEGVELRRGSELARGAARLGFRGRKDNGRAVGAVVDFRAGPIYRRIFWRGTEEIVGVGNQARIDWLRVVWPNGIVQYERSTALGDRARTGDAFGLFQTEGLTASCPFLYARGPGGVAFVSDVLGITPLGLQMAPGSFVPPDHDEYVLVRGDQLAPVDGVLEIHLTEELREVTYLDRVRLEAVDHPEGTEIFPNERFTFPPFPEPHTHTVRGALAPLSATDGEGRDWTAALARTDDGYAAPFELAPPQMSGLATPHTLELAFDREAVARAPKLRLVMTGWFYWTDASVNLAAARDPAWEFVPPILQVPDGAGGWRDSGPPIGFPAGKTKTMVVDVTDILSREDPRLRLFSTLRLYWDSIRLAVDGDDAELAVQPLEPVSAVLWRRGFSAPIAPERDYQPERFEWGRLAEDPRWNPHPGFYTPYGESLPLVTAIDDRFAILGSGDALTVRFDARSLAPVREGFVRDWLVFLDGWAKDRDPNTVEALHVEPLPFHGMSGYPYGPGERFPDTEAHRAWRREWLTRPDEPWIPFGPQASPARSHPSPEHALTEPPSAGGE